MQLRGEINAVGDVYLDQRGLWDWNLDASAENFRPSITTTAAIMATAATTEYIPRQICSPWLVLDDVDNHSRRATTRASLLASHGDDTVILSSANTYSYDKRKRRLR
jgi:hypothetical protein